MRNHACNHQSVTAGVWLPQMVVERLPKTRLGRDSIWRVLLAVLLVQYRYGGRVAYLTSKSLSERTGLSLSTVKRVVRGLLNKGLLVRPTRHGALTVTGPGGSVQHQVQPLRKGVTMLTPRGGQHGEPSATSILSLSSFCKEKRGAGEAFSPAQAAMISDVIRDVSELLGHNARDLELPDSVVAKLSMAKGTTYGAAIKRVQRATNRHSAGILTRAVLALRHDVRVQGHELRLSSISDQRKETMHGH